MKSNLEAAAMSEAIKEAKQDQGELPVPLAAAATLPQPPAKPTLPTQTSEPLLADDAPNPKKALIKVILLGLVFVIFLAGVTVLVGRW